MSGRYTSPAPLPPVPTLFAIELPFVENHAGFSDLLQRMYSQTSSPYYYFHIYCQSRARFNTAATTQPCFQANKLLSMAFMSILVVATPPRTFFVFFLVSEAALRCRIVVVGKLINCRVPSSVLPLLLNPYTQIFSVG